MHKYSLQHRRQCRGFTMVELLIVIAIIALLVTILVMAIGPTLETARINATKATIRQINDVIQQRVDAIEQLDLKQDARRFASSFSLTTNPQDLAAAEFLIRSTLLMQALPTRREDLFGFNGLDDGGAVDDAPFLDKWTGEQSVDLASYGAAYPVPSQHRADLSSEILLFALTQGTSVRASVDTKSYPMPMLDLGGINPRHVADTSVPLNNRMEFVDAWGKPLQFYLFPTRLIRRSGPASTINTADYAVARVLVPTLPAASSDDLGIDPSDPIGIYASRVSAFREGTYRTPSTKWMPLLVSAGPDQEYGMFFPTLRDNRIDSANRAFTRLGYVIDRSVTSAATTPPVPMTTIDPGIYDNITNHQP